MKTMFFLVMSMLIWFSVVLGQEEYNKFEVSGGYSSMRVKTRDLTAVAENVGTAIDEGKNYQFNGFDASVTVNFNRYLGAKFATSGHFGSYETIINGTNFSKVSGAGTLLVVVPNTVSNTKHRLYNFLGGVHIKDNAKEGGRFKPFAHALLGAAHESVSFETVPTLIASQFNNPAKQTSLAGLFGGGLDIRLSRRVDLRVIQVEYNPVFHREQQLFPVNNQFTNLGTGNTGTYRSLINNFYEKQTTQNFRFGFGIVFH